MVVLGVMVGGALGALLRYLTNITLQGAFAGSAYAGFPLATLLVNVVGSFLLSFLVYWGVPLSPTLRAAIGTGLIGALTTFSTFEVEIEGLWRSGHVSQAALYGLGNLVLGFGGVLLGRFLAGRLGGAV